MINGNTPTSTNMPPRFVSDVLFWIFIVCEFVALWIFGCKMPGSAHSGNSWAYSVGVIGIICLITSRAIAIA
jgi:hypothetical protein